MVNRILILLFLSSLAAACGSQNSHAAVPSKTIGYRLQPGELVLAASPEDIPPIQATEELFVPAQKADLDPQDLIVGVFIGGESRAYPVRLLSLHEVVNDSLGDRDFAVTWCPLCFSPVVYDRVIQDKVLTFRASGFLLNDNLVLEDLETKTLWSQFLGQGIRGALRGEILQVLPSTITTWETWIRSNPDSWVLDARQVGYEDQLPDPYRGYFSTDTSGLSGDSDVDPRLPGKRLIYGFRAGENTAALAQSDLIAADLIHFQIAEIPVLAVYELHTNEFFFYVREAKGEVLSFVRGVASGTIRDEKTGTVWSTQSGTALKGPLQGELLPSVQAQLAFWFAWSAFYPDTVLVPIPR